MRTPLTEKELDELLNFIRGTERDGVTIRRLITDLRAARTALRGFLALENFKPTKTGLAEVFEYDRAHKAAVTVARAALPPENDA